MGVKQTKVKMMRSNDFSAIDCIPVEILQQIFLYVPARDLLTNCSRVCKRWHELVNDEVLWRRRCDADGVVYPANMADQCLDLTYQRLYCSRPFCRNLVKNWNAAGKVIDCC